MKTPEGEDHRYTVVLTLVRHERPKYWEFHCPFCMTKIFELDGSLVHMKDVTDDAALDRPAVRYRCPGTNKKWCRMWYAIQLAN